jgi:hypothetical protein
LRLKQKDFQVKIKKSVTALVALSIATGAGIIGAVPANAATQSCASITKALVVSDGYTAATGPVVTAYNYTKISANPANALGTTYDFGAKALVVACVSPADIAKLVGKGKPTMTADAYLAKMAKDSAGAMKKTMVGGVSDYLDFGNGKEDGLGSTMSAGSIRLDAWVAGGKYIVLTFSGPASSTPSKALLAFIKSSNSVL